MIIGVDEAGRGPLAGPVVAAAVVLCDDGIAGLDDSKKLTARRRAVLEAVIKARCQWAVGIADVGEIDRFNILNATMLAMTARSIRWCGRWALIRRRCWLTATACRHGVIRRAPLLAAMRQSRAFRPPALLPRDIVMPSCARQTRTFPAMAGGRTRAMAVRRILRRCANWGRPRCTGAALPRWPSIFSTSESSAPHHQQLSPGESPDSICCGGLVSFA